MSTLDGRFLRTFLVPRWLIPVKILRNDISTFTYKIIIINISLNVDTFEALNLLRSKNFRLRILLGVAMGNNSQSVETEKFRQSLRNISEEHNIDGAVLEEQFLLNFLEQGRCQELQVIN